MPYKRNYHGDGAAPALELERSPSFEATVRSFRIHNTSIQFWAYEGGNVIAAMAGVGGILALGHQVQSIASQSEVAISSRILALIADHGDIAVALLLGLFVISANPILRSAKAVGGDVMVRLTVSTMCLVTFSILVLALAGAENWITVSAAAFAVGSCFLRGCRVNPFLLKVGGLALASGGVFLIMFGAQTFGRTVDMGSAWNDIVMSVLTMMTGFYVTGASLLTYQAGIFAVRKLENAANHTNDGLWQKAFVSSGGHVSLLFQRLIDPVVVATNRTIVLPSLFWIPSRIKANKPLLTSMWARLPWRLATGVWALFLATPEMIAFAIANMMWAVGDVAIGSLEDSFD